MGGWIVVLLIGAALWWHRPRRNPYPDPATFIIEPAWDGQPFPHEERALPLQGAINCRDLGGYPTEDGRRVRRGLVIRCGELSGLTAADHERLLALGVRLACDLRTGREADRQPDHLPAGISYAHTPAYTGRVGFMGGLLPLMRHRSHMDAFFRQGYVTIVLENAPNFGAVLRRLSDPANLPAIIHCTAGKDRAGITVALLLAALGVPEDVILADYSQSNRCFADFRAAGRRDVRPLLLFGLTVDDLQPIFAADPANLRAVFAAIKARYGSVEGYLLDAAGLDADTLARLRENLLET